MRDFETMPIGTLEALRDAAALFREYEQHHRAELDKAVLSSAKAERTQKVIRNQRMAERLENLLAERQTGRRP